MITSVARMPLEIVVVEHNLADAGRIIRLLKQWNLRQLLRRPRRVHPVEKIPGCVEFGALFMTASR